MGPVCMKPGATRIIQELKREISGEIQGNCGFIAGRRESLKWLLITVLEFLTINGRDSNQISRRGSPFPSQVPKVYWLLILPCFCINAIPYHSVHRFRSTCRYSTIQREEKMVRFTWPFLAKSQHESMPNTFSQTTYHLSLLF